MRRTMLTFRALRIAFATALCGAILAGCQAKLMPTPVVFAGTGIDPVAEAHAGERTTMSRVFYATDRTPRQDPQTPARIVAGAFEQAGRIDVLINNASVFGKMPLEEFDVKKWHDTMQINLAAPIQLCQQVAPAMRARGGGCIVNFCDARSDRPSKHYLAYGPSKAGLDYATRALARALAPEIRVNGVAPGIAVFPEDYSRELRDKLISEVPLRREGTPEAMAGAVRFLVEADYITGQIINVDGGWSVA